MHFIFLFPFSTVVSNTLTLAYMVCIVFLLISTSPDKSAGTESSPLFPAGGADQELGHPILVVSYHGPQVPFVLSILHKLIVSLSNRYKGVLVISVALYRHKIKFVFLWLICLMSVELLD